MGVSTKPGESKATKSHSLKQLSVAVVVLATITACVNSGVNYRRAETLGDYGYSDQRLSDTRYRVSFSGNSNTPVSLVQNFALLRAAELTAANDYEWFEVESRVTSPELLPNQPDSEVAVVEPVPFPTPNDCSLPGCTTRRYSPTYSIDTVDFPPRRQKYTTSLEIVFSSGSRSEQAEVYGAQEILAAVEGP